MEFTELIEKIKDGKVSRDEVIGDLNKVDISPYIVVFLRLLTAAYMEKHSDDFIFFLEYAGLLLLFWNTRKRTLLICLH